MAIQTKLYDIEYFPEDKLLHVVVRDIFDLLSHGEYTRDLLEIGTNASDEKINILADLRGALTQPKEVSKDNAYMAKLNPYVRKTAMIVASTLYKLQLQRSANGPTLQYFDDIDLARKWLNE